MLQHQELALHRSFSCNTRKISPETSPARRLHARSRSSSSSSSLIPPIPEHELFLVPFHSVTSSSKNTVKVNVKLSFFSRAIINLVNLPPSPSSSGVSNQLITGKSSSLGRRVTGTLYGHRRGHVTFSVQDGPRAEPVFLLDLAMSTETLGKEMSSGLVRIALECERRHRSGTTKLFHEPKWTMYCNGRKYGSAVSRGGACTEMDLRVLNTVSSVTVGAGVIPTASDVSGGGTELLYMRGTFERVVGGRDSEAFYMMNPDENEGPELSIFLLRL
ncbi:hypothetical protein F2Q70_00024440 [Brassica cretica]|uniref:Protein MIZU-KUSSEI 1 n=1 Tax=Brassica cretica TaxID=69181 RepID=A0A8S9L940_BRACR|nr:hypothetical protein F2Q70_00024440 [Brassica cretica]KAF3582693.1 hypothetical protein DY000_02028478 [Brassica cretica]